MLGNPGLFFVSNSIIWKRKNKYKRWLLVQNGLVQCMGAKYCFCLYLSHCHKCVASFFGNIEGVTEWILVYNFLYLWDV